MNKTIAIIGLGYVGLPLAVEFGKQRDVIGFDINPSRINSLCDAIDTTNEVSSEELKSAQYLTFTTDENALLDPSIYIVTVPSPVDINNRPDFKFIEAANQMIAKYLVQGDIVIYESTVYPGATEEICVPTLEGVSGLKFNEDFFVGYSPERINPGDNQHKLSNIVKLTSGSNEHVASEINDLYAQIVDAGTFRCSSIRVAEAAKVIENTQRDVNIALINELAMLFNRLELDTWEILRAAGTKWNFLNFSPGLVGGHCIGVDPYYLTHKAQAVGFYPEMILAGRRINDALPVYAAQQLVKLLCKAEIAPGSASVLLLGCSFKEDCPDTRNSKVLDLIENLQEYNIDTEICDPVVWSTGQQHFANHEIMEYPNQTTYDAVIIAVQHQVFATWGAETISKLSHSNIVFDLKKQFPDRKDFYSL